MKNKGFSLIELVIVITITGVALGVLIQLLGTLTAQSQTAQITTVATNLARERMEEVLSDRFAMNQNFDSFTDAAYPDELPITGFPEHERRVQIDYVNLANLDVPVAGPTNYKRVAVTVTHPDIGDLATSTIVTRRISE